MNCGINESLHLRDLIFMLQTRTYKLNTLLVPTFSEKGNNIWLEWICIPAICVGLPFLIIWNLQAERGEETSSEEEEEEAAGDKKKESGSGTESESESESDDDVSLVFKNRLSNLVVKCGWYFCNEACTLRIVANS